jgi:uncharacterized protein
MRIAIVSDTHSRYETIEKVLKRIDRERVDLILHCGDIEDSEAVWLFPPNTHFVFGNCDSDRASIRLAVHGVGANLYEPLGRMEIDDKSIAWLHGDDKRLLQSATNSGEFDFLFHGHTHVAADNMVDRTRVINPGALHRARPKTFLVLDLPSGEVESVTLESS